jgi:uncharacterized membrane protein
MEEKMIALIVILAMVVSMSGLLWYGRIDTGMGMILLTVFSAAIAFAAVIIEGWSGKED